MSNYFVTNFIQIKMKKKSESRNWDCYTESENIACLGVKICDIVALELKTFARVDALKKGIKEWKPKKLPFRICKR